MTNLGKKIKTVIHLGGGGILLLHLVASLPYFRQGIVVLRVNWGKTQSKPANTTSYPGCKWVDVGNLTHMPRNLTGTGLHH